MGQNKKQKRVNLSREQLLENARRDRTAKILAGSPLTSGAFSAQIIDKPRSKPSEEAEKTVTPLVVADPKPRRAAKQVSILLTVADLCQLLNLSRSSIARMERAGSLPGRVMVGGSVRYHRETIENWIRGKVV